MKTTFTSESVTEGHPDKMADQISDAVLDAILEGDPSSRVACETLLTTGLVVVAGEVTTSTYVDIPSLVRETVCEIGYDNDTYGFNGRTCGVLVSLDAQSPDIAQGVDAALELRSGKGGEDLLNAQGAGDQGMMFGYALRRDAGPDAAADLAGAPPLRAPGPGPSGRRRAVPAPGRQDPGVRRLRGWAPGAHRHRADLDAARERDRPGGAAAPRPDRARHQAVAADGPRQRWSAHLREPDGHLRARRPTRRHRSHRPQDHRGHLRRDGSPRRGGVLGQGPLEGRPLGGLRRRGGWPSTSSPAVRRGAARCRWRTPSASPIRCRSRSRRSAPRRWIPTRSPARSASSSTCARPPSPRDLDLRRPIYKKTAAYGHFGRSEKEFTWEATPRVDDLRAALGL